MKSWWTCTGRVETSTGVGTLAKEDVLAASAEMAAYEYAIQAAKDGRACDGDTVTVYAIQRHPGTTIGARHQTVRLKVAQRWHAFTEPPAPPKVEPRG